MAEETFDFEVSENKNDGTLTVGNEETGKVVGIPADDKTIHADRTIERPEYLLPKYKTVEDQAKAYTELDRLFGQQAAKLGQFTGAPSKYELPTIENWAWDENSESLKSALAQFKEAGASQEFAQKILTQFATESLSKSVDVKSELSKIGENANEQINLLKTWATNNLTPQSASIIEELLKTPTASNVRLLNELRSINTGIQPTKSNFGINKEQTLEDLKAEYANNLYTGKKIAYDEIQQKEYEKRFKELLDKQIK